MNFLLYFPAKNGNMMVNTINGAVNMTKKVKSMLTAPIIGLLVVVFVVTMAFQGCSGSSEESSSSSGSSTSSKVSVLDISPSSRSESSEESSVQQSQSYVLNTNTKKFHRPSCRDVKRIKAKNYGTIDSREEAIAAGYSPCGHCHP